MCAQSWISYNTTLQSSLVVSRPSLPNFVLATLTRLWMHHTNYTVVIYRQDIHIIRMLKRVILYSQVSSSVSFKPTPQFFVLIINLCGLLKRLTIRWCHSSKCTNTCIPFYVLAREASYVHNTHEMHIFLKNVGKTFVQVYQIVFVCGI